MELLERVREALAGRYDVVREVGEGGAAVVFLAQDLKHGRPVAIKVLRPELAAAVGAGRFLREIEIAATLSHPNILPLHDSGSTDGLLYYVMPFVEGESLRARLLREGPLEVHEAVRVVREACDALGYAHARGLVHRDVKPENVLFQAGHAVVSDFGVARAIQEAGGEGLTQTGLAVGTVRYMSPEQAVGDEAVDARADVYAAGCVLYELLTGAAPHEARTHRAQMARKLTEEPVEPKGTRGPIPASVREVLRRALAREPSDRYATGTELAEALSRATTETAMVEAAARVRRGRLWRGVAVVAAVGLLALAGPWVRARMGARSIERIAVLPLTNLTNDSTQAYLVQGIHEALISELQQAGATIIGRTSVMRYRRGDTPVREIASELHVDGVLEGSVMRAGDSVGVQVRLVDGTTEAQLWSGSYDSTVSNVLGLYRDITAGIADEVRLALSPHAARHLAETPTVDPQVYEAVLQGNFYRAKLTPQALETAEQYFERAIALDSTSAAAHAGLATVWGARAQMGLASMEEARARMLPEADRAIALDDSDARVHFMLATVRTWGEWSWTEAERSYRRAVELDPAMAQAHAYFAHHLYIVGRPGEAREEIAAALDADPLDPLVLGLRAMTLLYEHRYEEAVEALETMRSTFPSAPLVLSTLRSAYHMVGRESDAIDIWRASYEASGNTAGARAIERGWEEGGYPGALRAAAESLEERARSAYVTPWQIGTLYVRAGEAERGLGYLERAFDQHDPNIPYLTVDPIFDFLRDEPRFRALVDRLDIPGGA